MIDFERELTQYVETALWSFSVEEEYGAANDMAPDTSLERANFSADDIAPELPREGDQRRDLQRDGVLGRRQLRAHAQGGVMTPRCSHCHGLATPCESCPHGEGDVLCANPQCDHYGEHVPPMNTTDSARPRYSQTGDGGGFRMLTRHHDKPCGCCSNPSPERVYQWHAFLYCTTCLHSIGVNAAGNYCTPKQYRDAWRELAS